MENPLVSIDDARVRTAVRQRRRRPILVTGLPRTGTTWIGQMLCAAPGTLYVFEPFVHRDYKSLSMRPHAFDDWFPYLTDATADERSIDFVETNLGLRCEYLEELKSIASPRDLLKFVHRQVRYQRGRLLSQRPVQKDPHALLSAPWLHERYAMQVLVTLRHPAAYVASIAHAKWRYPLQELAKHRDLMEGPLQPFADRLDTFRSGECSLTEEATLMWNCLTSVILGYRHRYQDWLFVRHEDLAQDPSDGFRAIFDSLGLEYTDRVEATIQAFSASRNPETSAHAHDVRRNSKATVASWKELLPPDVIAQIREETAPLAEHFYSLEEWL